MKEVAIFLMGLVLMAGCICPEQERYKCNDNIAGECCKIHFLDNLFNFNETKNSSCVCSCKFSTTTTTRYGCAKGRECIDVCNSTLLVMREGECRTGCTIYNDKLVGYYELEYALKTCGGER